MPQDDPAYLPWALPSSCQQKGLTLRGAPWHVGGGRRDPDEAQAEQVAALVAAWYFSARFAARNGLPRPSRADLEWLWASWPGLCRERRLPKPEEWEDAR